MFPVDCRLLLMTVFFSFPRLPWSSLGKSLSSVFLDILQWVLIVTILGLKPFCDYCFSSFGVPCVFPELFTNKRLFWFGAAIWYMSLGPKISQHNRFSSLQTKIFTFSRPKQLLPITRNGTKAKPGSEAAHLLLHFDLK